MRIDLSAMHATFSSAQRGKASHHTAHSRLHPSRWQYDYLTLKSLSDDMRRLLIRAGPGRAGAWALDLGCHHSPYRTLIEANGYSLKTLDLTTDDGADFAGTAESTSLADASFDLVICTQVLEHSDSPWRAMAEIARILKAGGHAIISVPHVWFYHPHPHDHWRFTQEGVVRLCEDGGLHPIELLAQGGTVLSIGQVLSFLLYGVLGRWGSPAFFAINAIAPVADRWISNPLFCHNFACLARKA